VRILIADDDEVSLAALEAVLARRGHSVVTAADGEEAWAVLAGENPPPVAVLDWEMPGADGPELCRRARADERLRGTYLILLTARGGRADVVDGLQAGANDYVTKPFHPAELGARVGVGLEVARLQAELAGRVRELEAALAQVRQLKGLLPICGYCKSIRDDQNYWHGVAEYLQAHSDVEFTHSICPGCWDQVVRPECERAGIPVPDGPPGWPAAPRD
jgi:CheY-like chemotaxis protein